MIKEKIGGLLQQVQAFLFLMFFVLFSLIQWWSGVAPRLIRGSEEREALHHAHISLDATLFFFLALFLVIWSVRPGTSFFSKLKPYAKMPRARLWITSNIFQLNNSSEHL